MTRRRTRRTTTARRNPSYKRRRRSNPSTRMNPGGGIQGIVMGGAYIGVGMWLGGLIQGFIPNLGSGMLMDLAKGVASAYVVGMIAGRFTGQAGLMAAGAFAPTAVGVIQSLMGGGLSSIGNLFGGSKPAVHSAPAASQIPAAPASPPSNVSQFPTSQVG